MKTAIDPLWQCLCPSWNIFGVRTTLPLLVTRRQPAAQCLNGSTRTRPHLRQRRRYSSVTEAVTYTPNVEGIWTAHSLPRNSRRGPVKPRPDEGSTLQSKEHSASRADQQDGEATGYAVNLDQVSTDNLYKELHALANAGNVSRCRTVAEVLIQQRKEKPGLQMYRDLILSNISHDLGSAWQAAEYLEEMREAGVQVDAGVCHALLKVCSVHPDHLLRNDILHYMASRWFSLSEEGACDVVVSLLREGLHEQAMERMDAMTHAGTITPSWLWDMAIYALCQVGEVEEATRALKQRVNAGEMRISRGVWYALLDKASIARYHPGVALVWSHQINTGYINPSSGICLNALSTASHAGDAVLGTDVFTHLSKRGTTFQAVHYEQLITCYLSSGRPDLQRAISILTIMALEKLEPTTLETRSLHGYIKDSPSKVNEALLHLRTLHQKGRRIPIAALNLLIECYVTQNKLNEAMKIYKVIHTFVPLGASDQKSFANIDTFNFLFRGCRNAADDKLASFLVSELLALRIKPTTLTYDRLILVFLTASTTLLHSQDSLPYHDPFSDSVASTTPDETENDRHTRGLELLDWSFRHFQDMQPLGWLPRFGTIEKLAVDLAVVADERCWDVLQIGEDNVDKIEGWAEKGKWVRRNVEAAWAKASAQEDEETELEGQEPVMTASGSS